MESQKNFLMERFEPLASLVRAARTARSEYQEEKRKKELIRRRSSVISSYLDSHQVRKLQIGAGKNLLEGWLNTDLVPSIEEIIYLDGTVDFPFAAHDFDYVYSEHLIEHLTYPDGLFMLQEIFRILEPGGKLRIATPNIESIVGLYSSNKSELQKRYLEWSSEEVIGLYSPDKTQLQIYFPEWDIEHEFMLFNFPDASKDSICFVVNNFFRSWDHKFLYDPPTLRASLEGVGFGQVIDCSPGESSDKNLRGIESHGNIIGEEMNRFETMVMEAVRPIVQQK